MEETNEQNNGKPLLRREREKRHWTQSEVAERLGVTDLSYGRWERGEATPLPVHRQALEHVFGISYEKLGFPPAYEEQEEQGVRNDILSIKSNAFHQRTGEGMKEHPSTYFVQDRSNEKELTRLQVQDTMITSSMGGALPEQPDPTVFKRVLDIGCGTGGWLIQAAKDYPTMTHLLGIDVSKKMIDYARSQAMEQGVADRVEFSVMDVLRMIESPPEYFDLVNQRLGVSYLRTWDWPKLLQEYQRICKRGGTVRVTESDISHGNSPALTLLSDMLVNALASAGHLKTPDMNATFNLLPALFNQFGFRNIQQRAYRFSYPADTSEGEAFYDDMKYGFRTLLPFLNKWTRVPENYESIYQQALKEMKEPGFIGAWNFLCIWADNPGRIATSSQ